MHRRARNGRSKCRNFVSDWEVRLEPTLIRPLPEPWPRQLPPNKRELRQAAVAEAEEAVVEAVAVLDLRRADAGARPEHRGQLAQPDLR
jgi:hypothetical protein